MNKRIRCLLYQLINHGKTLVKQDELDRFNHALRLFQAITGEHITYCNCEIGLEFTLFKLEISE
ncbi:hypothetical protein [Psychrobacillus phage Perkons]|nr:hypothetical protein [Psychrobacillus phage Perkons]